MQLKFLWFFIFIIFVSCQKHTIEQKYQEDIYDTVVVGGGISGIKTAYELREKKIILLEKEERLGGRIWTKNINGTNYEIGALFGYTSSLLPENFNSEELIETNDKIGCYTKNHLYLEDNMFNAIKASMPQADQNIFKNLSEKNQVSEILPKLTNDSQAIIRTAFNIIHPGKMNEYVKARMNDAFFTFKTAQYPNGNNTLLDAYLKELNNKYLTGAKVLSVEQKENYILTTYIKNNKTVKLKSKTAVITTPSYITSEIIKDIKPSTKQFLKAIKYGKGAVVSIIVNTKNQKRFKYIITPNQSFNTIFQNLSKDKTKLIYTIYFIDSFITNNPTLKAEDYVNLVLKEIKTMNIGIFDEKNILHKDGYVWKNLGTIISQEPYITFTQDLLEPIKGVFLAGDYTFWNDWQIPYGIEPAFKSGIIASKKVKKYLEVHQNE